MLLLITSFIAGFLTVLAPCTLPLLPIIIGSSASDGKKNIKKAIIISSSLGLSVIVFTLILKATTTFIDIPQNVWSIISGSIIIIFGLISLFPSLWENLPFVSKINILSNRSLSSGLDKKNIWGDIIIGASLGPVFSTCSPTYFIILATVSPQSFILGLIYLFAYAIGLSSVLLLIAFIGQRLVVKLEIASDSRGKFKKWLGILFIILGVLIAFGIDKKIETKLVESNIFDITKVEQKLLQLKEKNQSFDTNDNDEQKIIAPEIINSSGSINTDGKPITLNEFRGNKVVLIDIWTYSCINCQRTLPYLNPWYEKYKDKGLVIIGIHTPEFAFEKNQENVQRAIKEFGIKYPVVMDNDYSIWNSYNNQYWPRKYLINFNGEIIYDHIGEGDYEKTEREIQKALVDLNLNIQAKNSIPMEVSRPEGVISSDFSKIKSPEVYFGANRNNLFVSGNRYKVGIQDFAAIDDFLLEDIGLNELHFFNGIFNFLPEEVVTSRGDIYFRYSAKNVYMVASSDFKDGADINIYRDGEFVKTINIKEHKLYNIIEGQDYGEHLLKIEIPRKENLNLHIFTLTFG